MSDLFDNVEFENIDVNSALEGVVATQKPVESEVKKPLIADIGDDKEKSDDDSNVLKIDLNAIMAGEGSREEIIDDKPAEKQQSKPAAEEKQYSAFTKLAMAYHKDNGFDDEEFDADKFEELVGEQGGTKALFTYIKDEVGRGVEEWKNSLSPAAKNYVDAIEQGIDPDEYKQVHRQQLAYNKITADILKEDTELQKRLISEALRVRGYKPEEITDEIKGYEDLGVLDKKATKSLEALKEFTSRQEEYVKKQTELRKQQMEQQKREYADSLKTRIMSANEMIPGVKLTTKVKEGLLKSMTTAAGEHPQTGQPVDIIQQKMFEHPQEMRMILHYLNQIGAFNFDSKGNFKPDFSSVLKAAGTKTVTDLESAIEQEHGKFKGEARPANSGKSKTADDAIKDMARAFGKL